MSWRWRRVAQKAVVAWILSMIGLGHSGPSAADQGAPPQIQLGEREVTVLGLPRGHSALLFGFGQDIQHHVMTLRRWEAILEPDDDGDLRLQLDRPVPYASVWVA